MAMIIQDWETALKEGDTGGEAGRGAEGAGSMAADLSHSSVG